MLAVTVRINLKEERPTSAWGSTPWPAGFVALEQNVGMASAVLEEQSWCPHKRLALALWQQAGIAYPVL